MARSFSIKPALSLKGRKVVRFVDWDAGFTQSLPLLLSLLVGTLVGYGAIYGGARVYEYGCNVETSGGHPGWHTSETDVTAGDLQQ